MLYSLFRFITLYYDTQFSLICYFELSAPFTVKQFTVTNTESTKIDRRLSYYFRGESRAIKMGTVRGTCPSILIALRISVGLFVEEPVILPGISYSDLFISLTCFRPSIRSIYWRRLSF